MFFGAPSPSPANSLANEWPQESQTFNFLFSFNYLPFRQTIYSQIQLPIQPLVRKILRFNPKGMKKSNACQELLPWKKC